MSTIQTDVSDNEAGGLEEAANAFETLWDEDAKKKKPSEDQADDELPNEESTPDEETEETAADEESSEGSKDETQEDKADKKYAEDEVYVKLTIDGKEVEAPVKDLKRLYGQEAALTRKSQEVATQRKAQETATAAQLALMTRLQERAAKAYEPYSKIDLLALSKDPNITAEDLTSLRKTIQDAWENYEYVNQDMSRFAEAVRQQQHNELVEQAKEAIKVLTDPEKGIKGWNEDVYAEVRNYVTEQGMDPDIVNRIVDPSAIKLMHKALLYDKGQAKVAKEPSAKPKVPKKIIKSTTTGEEARDSAKPKGDKDAMTRLRNTGKVDDAANAFMARWSSDND